MIIQNSFWKERKGFTIVEVLIVVAIISLLLALGIPNFHQARLQAKATHLELTVEEVIEMEKKEREEKREEKRLIKQRKWTDKRKYKDPPLF